MRSGRRWLSGIFFLLALLVGGGGFAAGQEKPTKDRPLWLVVGRAGMVEAITPLAEKRRGDGFETVVSNEPVAKALAAAGRRPDFLLLVGDDQPGKEAEAWYLPARRTKLYRWRKEQAPDFAADAAWGDLDGDGLPDIPVGRIPARTWAQAELAVGKILAYERGRATAADLQMPVWGASPEYGALIGAVAGELLLGTLQANAPAWVEPWVICGQANHPLCGWPPDQPARFTRQMRQAGICSVMMGHADSQRFFSMRHGMGTIWYSAADAAGPMAAGPPAPPLVVFSCESGKFDGAEPCMAESLFFLPGGPVAVIAATTESHPLTNYFSARCLLQCLEGGRQRIGPLWLAAQREALKKRDFLMELALRDVEGKLEDPINVQRLRKDQVLMYALLGDPATRLRLPGRLKTSVERTAAGWRWTAQRPAGATGLAVGHRPPPGPLAAPAGKPTPESARRAFEAANAQFAFTALPPPPAQGPWQGTINRPGTLRLVATCPDGICVAALKLEGQEEAK